MVHESLKWLRIISHLTATNEKLVDAYNYTLNRLENVSSSFYLNEMKKRSQGRTQNKWRWKTRSMISQKKNLNPGKFVRKKKKDKSRVDLKKFQSETQTAILMLSEGLENQKKIVSDMKEDCKLFMSQNVTNVDTFRLENNDVSLRVSTLQKELSDLRREVQQCFQNDKIHEKIDDKFHSIEPNSTTEIHEIELTESGTDGERTLKLEDFKKELSNKRELRKQALDVISKEMKTLRQELQTEKEAHAETSKILENLKDAQVESQSQTSQKNFDSDLTTQEFEAIRISESIKISNSIMHNLRFELEKMDDLRYHLGNDADGHKSEIDELRKHGEEVRLHLRHRENQISKLKDRLALILVNLEDTTFLDTDDELKCELRNQIDDLNRIRRCNQNRCKTLEELNESTIADLNQTKRTLESFRETQVEIEEQLLQAKNTVSVQDGEISNLESQLGLAKADCRDLQGQISIINTLFTQILLSGLSPELDLDHLTKLLQENHDLIKDMTNGNNAEALPKLLLDLIEQVDGRSKVHNEINKEDNEIDRENIAHNLPKVWRILMELLSCYEVKAPIVSSEFSATDSCYKSVDTPSGPRLVISVSKTYIRLKELILEKKQLEKEMNKMKRLNFHLENKLLKQEQRLSTVSDELSKTWTIVDRMQAQHQQLHTHEKILRYELQQKRKMLQELKQELEYCREKWESARQKNTNTELEWRSLQQEFVARKMKFNHTDSLNSPESGFGDSQDEEDETKKLNVRKLMNLVKNKTDNLLDDESQASSCDVDSEAQQDETLSGPKELSPNITEQQDLTLEEDIDSSVIDEIKAITCCSSDQPDISSSTDTNDPLDKALTNVIRNLIKLDTTSYTNYEDAEKATVLASNSSSDPENEVAQSQSAISNKDTETVQEATSTDRAARLKHLEEQAEWLLKKMSATNRRGSALSNKLEELHEVYGHVPTPPALPDVLPVFKIPTVPDLCVDKNTSQESQTSTRD